MSIKPIEVCNDTFHKLLLIMQHRYKRKQIDYQILYSYYMAEIKTNGYPKDTLFICTMYEFELRTYQARLLKFEDTNSFDNPTIKFRNL